MLPPAIVGASIVAVGFRFRYAAGDCVGTGGGCEDGLSVVIRVGKVAVRP